MKFYNSGKNVVVGRFLRQTTRKNKFSTALFIVIIKYGLNQVFYTNKSIKLAIVYIKILIVHVLQILKDAKREHFVISDIIKILY